MQFTVIVMENGSNGLRLTGVTDVTLSCEKVSFNFLYSNPNIREKARVILYGNVYKK